MDTTTQDVNMSSDTVSVFVHGLDRAGRDSQVGADGSTAHAEELQVPRNAPITAIWDELAKRGYDLPDQIYDTSNSCGHQPHVWTKDLKKRCFRPCEAIEVVDNPSLVDANHIHIDEPLISFANRHTDVNTATSSNQNATVTQHITRIEGSSSSNVLDINDRFTIEFHRTVRMPDDDRLHQLPASLGLFPLYNVSAYAERLPDNIVQKGGIFLPMWSREALWMSFTPKSRDPCAVRVYVGHINAVTGSPMDEVVVRSGESRAAQDYIVVPGQQWLDGVCVDEGVVRQFVAMPLGAGYTVEGQKTGDEKHGGLQIEVIPTYKQKLKLWLPGTMTLDEGDKTSRAFRSFLDEYRSPSDLDMKPGDKLHAYPQLPFFYRLYRINELMADPGCNEINVKAVHRQNQATRANRGAPNLQKMEADASTSRRYMIEYEYARSAAIQKAQAVASGVSNSSHPTLDADQVRSSNMATNVKSAHESVMQGGSRAQPQRQQGDISSKAKLQPKDLKAMGLAAGGKLIQDIYRDPYPARIWNTAASQIIHVHLLDPSSCEKVTHIVPPPPPTDAAAYVEADLPFFVVEEQVDNRVEGGDFDNVKSVSAMDRAKGIATEPTCDPNKPTMCTECQIRLCDCIIRPCGHQFCNVCVKKVDLDRKEGNSGGRGWQCPKCQQSISHVAGFSAPMNLPGEEAMKSKVPVHVLKVEDGRLAFQSIQKMRI